MAGTAGGRGSPPRLESRLERASMARPQPLDRILILKEQWLQQILLGGKTMEIRCRPLAAGRYWLGCSVTASLLGHIGGSGTPPGTRRRCPLYVRSKVYAKTLRTILGKPAAEAARR